MVNADHQVAEGSAAVRGLRSRLLQRIPLVLRATIYYVSFLAFALILLPLLSHRLATLYLPWQIEIGWGRAAGWMVFALCYAAYTLASYHLMRRGRGAHVEFDPPREFVATGPFRWCRNPIALGLLGMLLGESLAFSSLGIFLLFLVGLPLAHLQVTYLEEPLLRRRFGRAYVDYVARVPRWLPRRPRGDSS